MNGDLKSRTQPRRGAVRVALLFGTLALAAGCESIDRADRFIDQQWIVQSNMLPPQQTAVTVRRAETSATVTFAPRSALLEREQRYALARFVERSGATRGDTAVVALSAAGGPGLTQRRVLAVARVLQRRGLRVVRSVGPGEPDVAVVTVSRLAAIPPDCPQWQNLIKNSAVDEHKPTFGCITSSSLATSVHQPLDLVSGRPAGPSDGPVMERGIQMLREGKFDTPVTSAGTGSPQSGAPGAK